MLPESDLIAKVITETTPAVIFYLGLLMVIFKLGSLYITMHFAKMVPVYERGVQAIERLSDTANQVALEIQREQHRLATGVRAAHDEIDAMKGAVKEV